jgi:hypothetical protein
MTTEAIELGFRRCDKLIESISGTGCLESGAVSPMAARGRSRDEHMDHRPIASLGNSDGDLKMRQWTMGGDGPRSGNRLYLEG